MALLIEKPIKENIEESDLFLITDQLGKQFQLPEPLLSSYIQAKVSSSSYKGVAVPATNPTGVQNGQFWFAFQPGTYTNFGGIVVAATEYWVIITRSNDTYTKSVVLDESRLPAPGVFDTLENLNRLPDLNYYVNNRTIERAPFVGEVGGTNYATVEYVELNNRTWARFTRTSGGSYFGQVALPYLTRTKEANEIYKVVMVVYAPVSMILNFSSYQNALKNLTAGYNILEYEVSNITACTINATAAQFPIGGQVYMLPPIIYPVTRTGEKRNPTNAYNRFESFKANWLFGRKVIFAGDSLTGNGVTNYPGQLMRMLPFLKYGAEINSVTTIGENSYAPTGVGGSGLLPLILGGQGKTAGASLFERSKNFIHFGADVLFIMIGVNDLGLISPFNTWEEVETGIIQYKADNPTWNPLINKRWPWEGSIPLGSVSDAPYEGPEIDIEASDPTYGVALFKFTNPENTELEWRVPQTITWTACYKGMLDRLTSYSQFHGKQIILLNSHPVFSGGYNDIPDWRYDAQKALAEKIIEIANYYHLPYVDVFNTAGITRYNYRRTGEANPYLGDGIHPTEKGAQMVALAVRRALSL